MEIITSVSNKIVKYARSLKAKKARDESGSFIVEGEKFVREIAAPWEIEFLMISEENVAGMRVSGIPKCYVVARHVFAAISDVVQPQGVLAVVRQRTCSLEEVIGAKNPLLLLLEDMQDPGNLGAVLRIAHGLGFCGVVMSDGCADVYNPKVIRGSAGSIFHISFVTASMAQAAAALKSRNVNVFAAKATAEHALFNLDFCGPTAFMIGNEARGLSEEAAALADMDVRIPIKAESLNASVACGILAYEAFRQRSVSVG